MRDITLEETIRIGFTTRAFATGVPTLLAGTPVLSILEENNATPITSGVSVSVSRASVAGLNEATIIATAANGYESGKSYTLYISTGTVGGTSVVGEKVGEFTIEASSAFKRLGAPAGASVSADNAAIKSDTGSIKTKTDFLPSAAAGAAGGVFIAGTNAATTVTTSFTATFTGNLTGDVQGNVVGSVDSVTDPVTVGTNNDKTGYALSTAGILAIWDQLTSALTTASTIGKLLVDNINATISSRATQTSVDDVPNNTEFNARTLVAANYATDAKQDTAQADLDIIAGSDGATLATAQPNEDFGAITKNATFSDFAFLMVLSSDNVTPATGLTVTGQRSINAGAFVSVSGVIAEISNGFYQFDALAADTNGDVITWKFSAATANDTSTTFKTVS